MRFTLKKKERLKHRKQIEELFQRGRSLFAHPIKMIWMENKTAQSSGIQVAFSASKRKYKKAVDRNRLKRLMREAYRKHKPIAPENRSYSVMFIYVGSRMETMSKMEKSMITLTKLFNHSLLQ